jgi:serine/threonine protein kinase
MPTENDYYSRKDKIGKLSKTLNILGLSCWILMLIEGIIMFIPTHNSLGQTIYETYGQNALASYLGIYIALSILFIWLGSRVSDINKSLGFKYSLKYNSFSKSKIYYDNKYEFQKELGSGGFGRVFLAKDIVSGRLVAIKELKNKSATAQENIIHEIVTVSKFQNLNIVAYHHHFWREGLLHLVMEYCAGNSLRSKIESEDYTVDEVFKWFSILTATLRIIHSKGITHHDIKPENILFTKEDEIKIADFGVANREGGTKSYLCPEFFNGKNWKATNIQIDIYALGVTLMESLKGDNIFRGQSIFEILKIHQRGDYELDALPHWQQEIILRAIHKTPELRFHFMIQFEEAIKARAVPFLLKPETLKAAELVGIAKKAMKSKKWLKAINYLDLAESRFPNQVFVYEEKAKYYLKVNQLSQAKECIETALRLNPRLELQKDLGWIHLGSRNYPLAMSLLSDHLHRNPTDYEAYNMLVQCYYETNRLETCGELSKMLYEVTKLPCFLNNYYLCSLLLKTEILLPLKDNHPILEYNLEVAHENQLTHSNSQKTLKTKLLFMDFRFNEMSKNKFAIETMNFITDFPKITEKPIIKLGRLEYSCNDIQLAIANVFSRRHCVIINSKNDCWIYDLSLSGCKINDEPFLNKQSLIGLNELTIADLRIKLNTDSNKLL